MADRRVLVNRWEKELTVSVPCPAALELSGAGAVVSDFEVEVEGEFCWV